MSAHVTAFYHAVKDEVAGCEVWLFLDNSTNHTKVAHDALCATRMNVGPGQYNSIMLKHQAPVLPSYLSLRTALTFPGGCRAVEKGMKEPYHFVFQDGMWGVSRSRS